jgi:hypothetical protein
VADHYQAVSQRQLIVVSFAAALSDGEPQPLRRIATNWFAPFPLRNEGKATPAALESVWCSRVVPNRASAKGGNGSGPNQVWYEPARILRQRATVFADTHSTGVAVYYPAANDRVVAIKARQRLPLLKDTGLVAIRSGRYHLRPAVDHQSKVGALAALNRLLNVAGAGWLKARPQQVRTVVVSTQRGRGHSSAERRSGRPVASPLPCLHSPTLRPVPRSSSRSKDCATRVPCPQPSAQRLRVAPRAEPRARSAAVARLDLEQRLSDLEERMAATKPDKR